MKMLKLNILTNDPESVHYHMERANKYLPKWLAIVNDQNEESEKIKKAAFKVPSFYFYLAYGNYGLENFNQVKPNFEKAAPFAYLRGFDAELKTHNNDWTIQEELNVCLLFGDKAILQKLITITPDFKTSSMMHKACFEYDRLLLKLGTQQSFCQSEIDSALTHAQNTKDKDVQQYILPLINAINALVNGQQAQWQAAIDMAMAWHTEQCKLGDLKNMIEGFICLNALMP